MSAESKRATDSKGDSSRLRADARGSPPTPTEQTEYQWDDICSKSKRVGTFFKKHGSLLQEGSGSPGSPPFLG